MELSSDGNISHVVTIDPNGQRIFIYADRVDPDSIVIKPQLDDVPLPALSERGKRAAEKMAAAQAGQTISFKSAVSGNSYEALSITKVYKEKDGSVREIITKRADGKRIHVLAERADPDSILISGTATPITNEITPPRRLEEFSATDRENAAYLIDKLPAQREQSKANNTPLSNYEVITWGSDENLLILNDPKLDPALHRWLAEAETQMQHLKNQPEELGITMAKFVEKSLPGTGSEILHPIRNHKYEKLTQRGTDSRLGDFIENQTGHCRHLAAALHLGLNKLGLESRIRYGKFKKVLGQIALENTDFNNELHAWVEVVLDEDRILLLDPSQNVYQVIPNTSHRRRRILPQSDSNRLEYDPAASYNSMVVGGHRSLNQDDIESILSSLVQ